ncbi:MAG TPA: preprotein translocase subunit SecG [bacterium]|nr:preprotein translocase subunit SecG [bacterium]
METAILIVHYVVCVFLVIVILLQAGKGADMGAAFGGSSQTVFGSRGAATFLSKLTTGVAIVFLLTSVSLASISRKRTRSYFETATDAVPVSTPAPVATPGLAVAPAGTPVPAASPAASPAGTPTPQ